jgi:UDP-N-acetyl-D-glucosamine dehydrogenase
MNITLLNKIDDNTITVGVIGMGYVGLPLLIAFNRNGLTSIGFDIDDNKIQALTAGRSYIKHIPDDVIKKVFLDGHARATSDFGFLGDCDAILIAVPTPLSHDREPDLSYVESTAKVISEYLRPGQIVILESTTYPGTTEEVLLPILETSGLKHGEDFLLAYSPEREDPNNPDFSTETIPKVVGGQSEAGLEAAERIYSKIVQQTVPVSSTRVAEAAKLMENIFRSVNIALVNELKMAFMKMDIDIWEVINAAKTKPFGFMPFYPGPGLGGHCIPIDPFYLTWKAKEFGITTRFIELAGEINTAMPDFVVSKAIETLNQYGKPVSGSKVLILGLAYKKNVDDTRESPSFVLMEKLEAMGAVASYNDPYIPTIPPTRQHSAYTGRESVAIDSPVDLIIVATDHDVYREFDFASLEVPILDTRSLLTGESSWFHTA